MSDYRILMFFIALNFLFFSPFFNKIVKVERTVGADEAQLERTAEYQRKVALEARKAMEKNPRIKTLHDRLVLLPRDGTSSRNIQRSKVLRDILIVSKSKMVAQGIILISEQERQRRANHVGENKGLKV